MVDVSMRVSPEVTAHNGDRGINDGSSQPVNCHTQWRSCCQNLLPPGIGGLQISTKKLIVQKFKIFHQKAESLYIMPKN